MFVGEMGIPRREFLYEIPFWEARRIIRGYRRRHRLAYQMMAECVYAATYAMRDPKGKTVADLFPSIFEDDDDRDDEPPISEEDKQELLDLMASINTGNAAGSPPNAGPAKEKTE